jgi:integrase
MIDQFVSYKRANGYHYQTGAYYLKKYTRFVMETVPETAAPDKASIEGFLEKFQDTPGSLYNAAAFLREFSRYLTARGIAAYLIPSGRLRLPTPVQPYFFTEGEITAFFRECDRIKEAPYLKGRHLVLPAVFRLLYCCGLRCKEARTLARENVHLDEGCLDILQSKGPKSRRIYISEELAEYLAIYDRQISRLFPNRETFFPNRKGQPYSAS